MRIELEQTKNRNSGRVSDELLLRIEKCLSSDPEDRALKEALGANRWTKDSLLDPFRSVRDNLLLEDGIIFHNQACFIPTPMRREILNRCHRSHLATDAMLRRARGAIF